MRVLGSFWGATFQRETVRRLAVEEVPSYLRSLLERCAAAYQPLGFAVSHWLLVSGDANRHHDLGAQLVLVNQTDQAFAILSLAVPFEAFHPCDAVFLTFLGDGRAVETLNGVRHEVVGTHPRVLVQDRYRVTPQGHWDAHRDSVQEAGTGARSVPTADGFDAAYAELREGAFEELVRTGRLVQDGRGGLRLARRTALWATLSRWWRSVNTLPDLQRRRLREFRPPESDLPVPTEADLASFIAVSKSRRGKPMSRGWKGVLFLASMIAFAVVFGAGDSAWNVLMMLLIIAFHEGGHVAAMHWFGYKDLSVLFLPFFGAVTMGLEEKHVSPNRKAVVALMGPVPGLLLGFGILASPLSGSPHWSAAAAMLIGINGINLLPVLPLDGGHFVNLLFGRWPLVQTLFHVVCSVAVVPLVGGRLGFWVGAAMLFSTRQVWRTAKLGLMLRREAPAAGPAPAREGRLHEGLRWVQAQYKGRLPGIERYPMVESALRMATTPVMTGKEAAVWSLIYALLIGAPVAALFLRPRGASISLEEFRKGAEAKADMSVSLTEPEIASAGSLAIPESAALSLRRYSTTPVRSLLVPRPGGREEGLSGLMGTVDAKNALKIVEALRRELAGTGVQAFQCGSFLSGCVGLMTAGDSAFLPALVGTRGTKGGADVIRGLKAYAQIHPHEVVGAGTQWVELKPMAPPADPVSAAKELLALSPQCGDPSGVAPEALTRWLPTAQTLFLCWPEEDD